MTAFTPLPETPISEIPACMARAREAQKAWAALKPEDRAERLMDVARQLLIQGEDMVQTLHEEAGKPRVEALSGDVLTVIDCCKFFKQHLKKALAPEKRSPGLVFFGNRFEVQYVPMGVVVVVAPWNYPLQLSLIPALSALAAGNAVILKPASLLPRVANGMKQICEAALPPDLLQVVLGGGEKMGDALLEQNPDKVFFTGSVQAGRQMAEKAAARLIPIDLELGGKDPMVVFADAPFERAISGACYGAFANAGQVCVSAERLYVERKIYEPFCKALCDAVQKLRVGMDNADVGPMMRASGVKTVLAQLEDAKSKGATLMTPLRVEGNTVWPLLIRDANHEMQVMKEESFGPILPVMPFETEDEVVQLANDSPYGLNASVWSGDIRRAKRVAERILSGSCAVNDVLKNIAHPGMPFGGIKASGMGRYHGVEGIRAFCHTRSLMINPGSARSEINWFPLTKTAETAIWGLCRSMVGSVFAHLGDLVRILKLMLKLRKEPLPQDEDPPRELRKAD